MTLRDLRRLTAVAVLVCGVSSAGLARADSPAVAFVEAGETFELPLHVPMAGLTSPGMNFVASEVGSSRLVKGAPYSAEAVSESTQVLMDGNKIQRRATQRLARDGQGRTRVERLKSDGTVESVMINDVVAGKRYWLLPDRKRVVELALSSYVPPLRLVPVTPAPPASPGTPSPAPAPVQPTPPALPTPPPSMTSDEARTWAEEMRRWAREFTARWRMEQASLDDADGRVFRDADGEPRVVLRQTHRTDDGARSVDVDVVRVIESSNDVGEAAAAAIAAIPPVALAAAGGQGVTTALGSKDFDRVRADGSRTTWTIPAGRIGNEKPIDVISERWFAPELLLVVSSRYLDPRRGETTYRLTGLKRGEPDASLFQVPADYERRPSRVKREKGEKEKTKN